MLNNHGDKRGLPHQQVTRNCLGYDQGIKLVHKIHMDCVLGLLFRGLLCNDRPFPPAEKASIFITGPNSVLVKNLKKRLKP